MNTERDQAAESRAVLQDMSASDTRLTPNSIGLISYVAIATLFKLKLKETQHEHELE
jgi:hypothetical protein